MILYGWHNFRDEAAYRQNPVEELARLYRHVRRLMDEENKAQPSSDAAPEKTVNAAVLAETAKLHAGDPECRRLWKEFLPYCEDEIERMYRRLDVRFDYTLGESFYQDRLGPLVDELLASGIARPSDGAVCVFLEGQKVPMIVRKKDGAFLYGTTDLATIRYRMETWRPDAILYVVDHRQSLHFQNLFAAARLLNYDDVELQHVSFGTVLGDDNRPFKTRRWSLSPQATTASRTDRSSRPTSGARSPRRSASPPSNTPTSRRTARATMCSATTRCWP
jgi:arginyl-tRNA synthetase